jgi:putative membrane protein
MFKLTNSLKIAVTLFSILFSAIVTNAQTPESSGPSDPEIAHIVVTANNIDIDAGKLAQSKTKNKDVKAFAKEMITDHTAVNKQATQLAKKLGVTPKDNSTSKNLMDGAATTTAKLKSLNGKDFDKEYIDHEVGFHETVLKTIDDTLVPNAKNGELKNLIVKVRPAIQAHLDHAKSLQSKM